MPLDEYVLGTFFVLCRIGSCVMLVPGISTARVPVRVRLFLAVVLAFVISPLIDTSAARTKAAADLVGVIITECVTGALIGFISRLFIEALEFAATAISSYIGLSGISGGIDDGDPLPTLASLITVVATLLLIIMDFMQYLVVALVDSYSHLPIATAMETGVMLRHYANTLSGAFMIGLRISAPFLVYGIVLNAIFAVLGKLVPQVSAYFVSLTFMALGGLLLLYFSTQEMFNVLMRYFIDVIMHT
ncbi:MAG: flagellar biosynthetic protein FliR [Hyphomicrobiaceae bacterium]